MATPILSRLFNSVDISIMLSLLSKVASESETSVNKRQRRGDW